mgnify:CR=1 FL=1
MTGPCIHAGEFRTYRVKPSRVTAIPLAFGGLNMGYVKDAWGPAVQTAKAGDWLVQSHIDGDVYTIDVDVFVKSYAPVGDPGVYEKFGTVEAALATGDGEIPTLEGTTTYAAGDYICRGMNGELWAMSARKFEARYTPSAFEGPAYA